MRMRFDEPRQQRKLRQIKIRLALTRLQQIRRWKILFIADEEELFSACDRLLSNPQEARAMGERARSVVAAHQGATERVTQDLVALATDS